MHFLHTRFSLFSLTTWSHSSFSSSVAGIPHLEQFKGLSVANGSVVILPTPLVVIVE
tara:strand:- start:1507 stop:1677 length:171 start_codon:yes stop_codon:yes gene_type:complete